MGSLEEELKGGKKLRLKKDNKEVKDVCQDCTSWAFII